MAKTKSKTDVSDVVQAFLEKRLIESGGGSYQVPGSDESVRGKSAAIKAFLKEAENGNNRASSIVKQAQLAEKIIGLRNEGKSLLEISKAVGVATPRVSTIAKYTEADAIHWSDEDDLAKQVVVLRDEENSAWGEIAFRAGVSIGKVKDLYESKTGKEYHSSQIGKGGRRPAALGEAPAKPKKEKSAKKSAKSAKSTKKSAKKKAAKKSTKKAAKKSSSKKATKKAPAKKAPAKKAAEPVAENEGQEG